ncbi:L-lactate dehydrogenase [cytochrome] [Bartonella bacilliformis Ver097]|uniref:L-lactate dehydrogenase [cytochrome] n=1 Tax=Bartonella bacilliformis Ver097 TaxID=1293911 RepID=A0A072R587_BARBA|nr:L-lactate dehydrogenase [cytochrome] [Bartonella bacilliformis Ver097]
MSDVLERSWEAGVRTLVFTVDIPVPDARYCDAHSGMAGPYARVRGFTGYDSPALGLER